MMLDILGKALMLSIIILVPLLGVTMLISVIISIVQAATQVQEMTLTFIPKLFVTLLMLLVTGPWIIRMLVSFTNDIFRSIPALLK